MNELKVHTVDKIIKVIAGEDDNVVETLARVYGAITSAGVFRADSIRAAEAAKVIENAQRDIDVAFMNEVTQILAGIGVSAWTCSTRRKPSGIFSVSSRGWSAATASGSIRST